MAELDRLVWKLQMVDALCHEGVAVLVGVVAQVADEEGHSVAVEI